MLLILFCRISRHLFRKQCVVAFRFPANIPSILHRKALHFPAVCFQLRCEGADCKKRFLFLHHQTCIMDYKPMVRCRVIIVKRQFQYLLFLRFGCRMSKPDPETFLGKPCDAHFHRPPVSSQKPERNHRNKCPLIHIHFRFPSVFHTLYSVLF